MQAHDFTSLSTAVRQRLATALERTGSQVYLFEPVRKGVLILAAAVALFGALVLYSISGRGDKTVFDTELAAPFVILAALSGLTLGLVVYRSLTTRGLPFKPGVYLAGLQLIDARTKKLKAYTLFGGPSFEVVHNYRAEGPYVSSWVKVRPRNGPRFKFFVQLRNAEAVDQTLAVILENLRAAEPAYAAGGFDARQHDLFRDG
jgi:hypothetical protein